MERELDVRANKIDEQMAFIPGEAQPEVPQLLSPSTAQEGSQDGARLDSLVAPGAPVQERDAAEIPEAFRMTEERFLATLFLLVKKVEGYSEKTPEQLAMVLNRNYLHYPFVRDAIRAFTAEHVERCIEYNDTRTAALMEVVKTVRGWQEMSYEDLLATLYAPTIREFDQKSYNYDRSWLESLESIGPDTNPLAFLVDRSGYYRYRSLVEKHNLSGITIEFIKEAVLPVRFRELNAEHEREAARRAELREADEQRCKEQREEELRRTSDPRYRAAKRQEIAEDERRREREAGERKEQQLYKDKPEEERWLRERRF